MNRTSLCCLMLSIPLALWAQDPTPPSEPPAAGAPSSTPTTAPVRQVTPSQDPQPYEKVITKEAKTKKGVFLVHQVKDKYYYEIPKSELHKEFLWNAAIARTTLGVGYGHQELGQRVVFWELSGNKVHLRENNYDVVADEKTPIIEAVRAANNSTIIMTFPVAAFAKNGAPVVEVTRLFTTDVPEISARQRLNATTMDASRSFIERISTFPENVEVEATITYTRIQPPIGAANTPTPSVLTAGGMRPGSATVVLHHSMVKLPEKPMRPRIYDERVGFFSSSLYDYGKDEQRAPRVRHINRWRLEKKDPDAAVSEPVKPIVYYIDSATPIKWRNWLKKGVEDWQPAFEAAGFKNAIIAKIAPTAEEDPDFAYDDVRNSVIRWLPSTIENAVGPNLHDPRTGEILNAPILLYHNVMNLQRNWYFVQAGPLDPRAKKLPLPDDLMGRMLEFVVAHEVGHTLGFQHNMKASSTYPQEKMRDPKWLHEMGAAPSIMDYARFNYVAQPEDKIPVEDLIPHIGPYDVWATKWGYTPIPGVRTAEDERPTLDKWSRQQDTTPWFRFSSAHSLGSDPGEQAEAIGDADALKSTALGIKNLQRVAKMLIPATTAKEGEPYDDLGELYGQMLGQWVRELNHVANIVGGFDTRDKYVGQEGVLYTPVSKARQEAAVKFLNENAFATPTWAIDPAISRRIEPVGIIGRVLNAQKNVLTTVSNSARFARLVEQEAIDGNTAYSPAEFLTAMRKGIWKELDTPNIKIDAYRRNLQHAYLDLANDKVNGNPPAIPAGLPAELLLFLGGGGASSDEKPMYRAQLRALNASVLTAIGKTTDFETRAHLEAARDQIAKILDPKYAPVSSNPTPTIRIGIDGWDAERNCWPDFKILPD